MSKSATSAAALAFASLSVEQRAESAVASLQAMGRLMAETKGFGKQAKSLRDKVAKNTIEAHAHNLSALVLLDLIDPEYGAEGHRNTTTGPAYMAKLVEVGFSEAKAKLFWEYGQLALKEPVTEAGDLTGLVEAAQNGPKAVLKMLAKAGVEKENDLRKIVQPSKTTPAQMVDKLTAKLTDAELEACFEEVRNIRLDRQEAAEAKASANVAAAVQQPMQQAA